MTRAQGWGRALVTLGLVVLADQVSKQLADSGLPLGGSVNIFLGLDLTNTRNQGVAFGALEGAGALIAVAIGAALVLLLAYFARHATRPWLWLATGLLLGGALGNLADRAREGAVIDFIDPIAWPVFNLADVAIVAGVLALLYAAEGSGR